MMNGRKVLEPSSSTIQSGFSRRSFISSASATLTLTACGGGGESGSSLVLLPTAASSQQPVAVATQPASNAAAQSENSLSPSATWSGVAGSGFSQVPADPLRQTAKPAMRLIVPPNQAYTDSLLVGVSAFANNQGSMLERLGIRTMYVHYEGNKVEITQPTYQTFNDANGKQVQYLGWWVRLKYDGREGDANLFFEAIPMDSSMQSRVMGPYLFLPSAKLYDLELTVAPSQSEISGSRYASIRAALAYAANQKKNRPRITLVEQRNDYTLENIGTRYTSAKGYALIDASVPVTIQASSFIAAAPRPSYDGLRFSGKNITIDHRNMETIYHEGVGNQHWFDGVTIMVTGGSTYVNPVTLGPKAYGVARNNPWFTECDISSLPNMVYGASLVRGCHLHDGLADATTDARCVIGNVVENFNSGAYWAKDKPAFTVSYIGDAESATLELSSYSDAQKRTFTARTNGNIISTFDVEKLPGSATACSSVVAWLNGLPGFRAILQDDTRRATMCSLPNQKGAAFSPTSVKGVNLQVVTMVDFHTDFWQHLFQGIEENVLVTDNVIKNFMGQCFFISSPVAAKDFMFINNCFHAPDIYDGLSRKDWMFSQIARSGAKSHLVVSHNSMTQAWFIRTDDGMAIDGYCLFGNNVTPSVAWGGEANTSMKLLNNHFFALKSAPALATGSTFGGSEVELWPRASQGDFTPAGALLSANSKPCVGWDIHAKKRGDLDSPGSVKR